MSSLQLLLRAEVTRVPTLLFTAIVCSRVEPGITPRREEGGGEGRESGKGGIWREMEMEERKEEKKVEGRKK